MELDDLPQPTRVETVPPDTLEVDGDNPNEQTDEMFGLLCENMRSKGWIGNHIITDTDGLIADGEHRWRAAQEIGLEEVPVKFYDIDDADRRLWRQELNKISGEHDTKRDALEYKHLLDNGKSDAVNDLVDAADEDLDELLAEIKVDKNIPPTYEYDPNHNVYFGDCVEGMRDRLEDDSVDCVVTDPPYGIDYEGGRGTQEFETIEDDGNVDDAIRLYRDTLSEFKRVVAEGSHLFIFTRWDTYPDFYQATSEFFTVSDCGVWVKNNWGMGHDRSAFRPQHEFIIHAQHGEDSRPLSEHVSDVFNFDRASGGDYDHPTQKPTALISRLLEVSSSKGDTVLDPFMGSGTTAVAAIQNNRDYVGFELDADNYKPVIERRISEAKRAVSANED